MPDEKKLLKAAMGGNTENHSRAIYSLCYNQDATFMWGIRSGKGMQSRFYSTVADLMDAPVQFIPNLLWNSLNGIGNLLRIGCKALNRTRREIGPPVIMFGRGFVQGDRGKCVPYLERPAVQ